MFINSVSPTSFTSKSNSKVITINGQKFIPRAEYKGPELKLTPEEEAEISSLRERLAEIAIKRLKLEKFCGNRDVAINHRDYYDNAFIKLDWECEMLLDNIEKIKENRHQIQMAQLKK